MSRIVVWQVSNEALVYGKDDYFPTRAIYRSNAASVEGITQCQIHNKHRV